MSALDDYLRLRQMRAQLEAKAAEIKEAENKAKAELLMSLDASGQDGFKASGYMVTRTYKSHVEITDPALFYETNFAEMANARAEGRPSGDAMLFQRTVAKNNVLALIRERLHLHDGVDLDDADPRVQQAFAQMGVKLVKTPDLSIRKSK